MAINRAQIAKELEPGLNAIFGEEYARYENEHIPLFSQEKSSRAYEEEVLFPGFGAAPTKYEGGPVAYEHTGEAWVARYHHETVALAFAITEESIEDNLYESLSKRLTKALARSMAHTKQVKAAAIYNNAFNAANVGGDNVALCVSNHPLKSGGTASNIPTVAADLSETSLEQALIDIAGFVDDKGLPISVMPRRLLIPRQLIFVAERLLKTPNRPGTADNDINAMYNMNMLPDGYFVNHRFSDTDAWFIRNDIMDGLKHFTRVGMKTAMEGDFETGNVRYKVRERYSFGWSDWRDVYGSQGA